ncbi:UBC-like protein [Cystobasidium minutum MCA 4210]|uniref:UBC-like protein n=1 Tax=Cystobasidium minutum MCA 4210 TaxID=1397322 RepID=UPI0034CE2C2A|eukprot:jgi/Rhomi1/109793/CE109792_1311
MAFRPGLGSKRLAKELSKLQSDGPPVGCALVKADDLETWFLSIEVLGDSVYQGEKFLLRFKFDNSYPMEAPEVTFVVDDKWKAPEHPHVYSNGHVCMSLLGTGWSPVLNTESLCLSIQSMLASCKKKERPPGNDRYVRNAPKSPKDTQWMYEDDTV